MKVDTTHYTECEEGPWIEWPFPKHIKPSNSGLLTYRSKRFTQLVQVSNLTSYHLKFHALKFSDNSIWDSINGFRDNKGAR